jgi:chromosome segregation ATPase
MATTVSGPITQKFLVGTVPCLLQFDFSNEYSWIREKVISYKITVTPPSHESLAAGRRRRANACLKAVEDDLQTATDRCSTTSVQKQNLYVEVTKLTQALEDAKKAYNVAEKEETWLLERKTLRLEQQKLLKQRLTKGWPDEVALQSKVAKQNGK